jgi:hypothetical protein
VKRWPLFFIALPAAVAVWSGWVGLGQLCGFGIVHPLPGIVDRFQINSAITLPVGVEAYGAYALGAWLTPGTPARARTFARRSAIGALVLGMLGQVVYHLLAAAHATRAPWPVVVLVACLPVVTLGFGAGLAHLLRDDDDGHADDDDADETAHETSAEVAVVEAAEPTPAPALVAVSGPAEDEPPAGPAPVPVDALSAAEIAFRATLAAGNPWSLNALAKNFNLTRAQSKTVRDRVLAETETEAQRRVRVWDEEHQPETDDDGQGAEPADDLDTAAA